MSIQTTFIDKYRPYYLNDFCTTDSFKRSVRTLVEVDELNILFIGNSNAGKTSLMNALIREYYGLGRHDSFPENNILFVNNLKEQGIQYFRNDMKTFCQSRSSIYGKKKMVLIDDIDTINEQSQQVFRNYIDKYYNNIQFVCVCSNVQKVVESIQSRLHIIQISPPTTDQVCSLMNKIIAAENISIDLDAKEYILSISNLSIRTMIGLLEKIYIFNRNITKEICVNLCSVISYKQFDDYLLKIQNKNLQGAIQIMYGLHDYGYSVIDIYDYLFTYLKTGCGLDDVLKYKMTKILCKYITIFNMIHEDCIELALFTGNIFELFHQPA
jgi:DNA polymerase III delta prime subunit